MKYKFRGKRKDNGEWIEGSLLVSKGVNDGKHYIIPKTVSAHFDSAYNALKFGYFYKVIPETVGMFTGKDDIWENDKYFHYLQYDSNDISCTDKELLTVKFVNCGFYLVNENNEVCYTLSEIDNDFVKVDEVKE